MPYIYVAPFMFCERCMLDIPLPYPDLPQVTDDQWREGEYESPMDSVPDEWTALFGCRECGHVAVYPGWHVGDKPQERANQARFHSETNCFSVRIQCAQQNCKVPATVYVNMHDGEGGKDLVRLLRSGFFLGNLPCGHQIIPIPEPYYRDAHRVLSRLW
jgi:hypothetical protein